MTQIEDQYRRALVVWSDIYEHLPTLVDLALELDARRVVELGVRFGTSTLAWLYAMEQTGGHLWSVDIAQQWVGIESDRWTYIEGDDTSPTVQHQLPVPCDVLFIDTSHEYAHTREELDIYSGTVRPEGAIVLHDTNVERFDHHPPNSQPPYPVRRAVTEFVEANERWCVAKTYDNNYGLTILRTT